MQNKKFRDRNFISQENTKQTKLYTFVLHTALGFDCEISKEFDSDDEYASFVAKLGHHVLTNALFYNPDSPIVKARKEN